MIDPKNAPYRTPILPCRRKNEKKARATIRGKRQIASKPGQCARRAVGKLICIFMMLMFVNNTSFGIWQKFQARLVGISHAQSNAKECHQGRSGKRTFSKVSQYAHSIYESLKNADDHYHVNVMQCKESAQNEEHGLAAIITRAKIQKPSPVCDKLEFSVENSKRINSFKGLMTPEINDVHKKQHQ